MAKVREITPGVPYAFYQLVKTDELQLGDVVQLHGTGPYMTATVIEKSAEAVTVVRPYLHIGDFACGGPGPGALSVIHYTGLERVTFLRTEEKEFYVYDRVTLR